MGDHKNAFHRALEHFIEKRHIKGTFHYISEGSFGKVFQVADKAIKIMRIKLNPHFDLSATIRELYTGVLIAPRSPFLMPILEMDIQFGMIMFEMPLASMGSLSRYAEQLHTYVHPRTLKVLSFNEKLQLTLRAFAQCICGVHTLHQTELLHLDLKPANIFVGGSVTDPRVQVGDFGMATWSQATFHRNPSRMITEWYRPPEMLLLDKDASEEKRHRTVTKAADIWSLAIILIQMLGNWMMHSEASGSFHFQYGQWFDWSHWKLGHQKMNGINWKLYLEYGGLSTFDILERRPEVIIPFMQNIVLGIMFGVTEQKTQYIHKREHRIKYKLYLNQVPNEIWVMLFDMLRVEPSERSSIHEILDTLTLLNLLPPQWTPSTYIGRKCEKDPALYYTASPKVLQDKELAPKIFFLHQLTLINLGKSIEFKRLPEDYLIPEESQCVIDAYKRIKDSLKPIDLSDEIKQDHIAFLLSVFLHWGGSMVQKVLSLRELAVHDPEFILNGLISVIRFFSKRHLEPVWSTLHTFSGGRPISSLLPALQRSTTTTTSLKSTKRARPPSFDDDGPETEPIPQDWISSFQ